VVFVIKRGDLSDPLSRKEVDVTPAVSNWSQGWRISEVGLALLLSCHHADKPTGWTDQSPHRGQFVAVAPGVTLEVLDWGGSGTPLVFLSGLQDVAHGFDDFAPRFTDHFHVLAITRRGYGASSQTPSGYDLATRVADLHALLDSLHLTRVALVGHSIAGDELTAFAGAYPDRVSHLVYLDAAYDHSGVGVLIREYPALPPMLAADSASPKAVQAYTLRTYGTLIPEAQLRAIGHYDSSDRLTANVTPDWVDSQVLQGCGRPDYKAVHTPALVIDAVVDSAPQAFPSFAQLDSTTQQAAIRFTGTLQRWQAAEEDKVRRELAGAQIVELHGANHYVFYSHPTEVTDAMRKFLNPRM
jgi:pimeloyl-ACP methyl ester carboxylesterase